MPLIRGVLRGGSASGGSPFPYLSEDVHPTAQPAGTRYECATSLDHLVRSGLLLNSKVGGVRDSFTWEQRRGYLWERLLSNQIGKIPCTRLSRREYYRRHNSRHILSVAFCGVVGNTYIGEQVSY
ncbi:MAG TPA: hypothetical protein V6C91_09225 [Coleofasciculaceae cyanobacterium]